MTIKNDFIIEVFVVKTIGTDSICMMFSDMAVSALVEALVTGQKIERLILAYNDTGHMSCLKLADLLLKCRTLEYLDWYKVKADVL